MTDALQPVNGLVIKAVAAGVNVVPLRKWEKNGGLPPAGKLGEEQIMVEPVRMGGKGSYPPHQRVLRVEQVTLELFE